MLTSHAQIAEERHHKLEASRALAHLTYLLKSGCTKVRWGHRRFPMYPGMPERHPYLRASSACDEIFLYKLLALCMACNPEELTVHGDECCSLKMCRLSSLPVHAVPCMHGQALAAQAAARY